MKENHFMVFRCTQEVTSKKLKTSLNLIKSHGLK